jgi:hypothetical protein
MLTELGSLAGFASLHTGNPGATGANEVTGGTPAYARKAVTWAAPSAGAMALSNSPTFDVPANTTITHVGIWSAASGGTFYGFGSIAEETFASQGTYQVTSGSADLNAAA